MKKEKTLPQIALPPLSKQSHELSKPMSHVIKASSLVADETKARERVGSQASVLFEQHYGSIVASEFDVQQAQQTVDKVDEQITLHEQTIRDLEPSFVPVPTKNSNKVFSWSVFSGWRTLDIALVFVLALFIPAMMSVATVNLASIIDNAQLPTFINASWKQWLIALIAPAAALALDLLPKSFNNEQLEKRYAKAMFVVMAITVISWVALFSITFDGFNGYAPTGGDDFNTELPPVKDTRLYSFVQLMSEILISSCLMTGLRLIFRRYQPLQEVPHPKLPALKEAYLSSQQTRNDAVGHLSQETQRHSALLNARQAFINHWLDELTIERVRYARESRFFEEK